MSSTGLHTILHRFLEPRSTCTVVETTRQAFTLAYMGSSNHAVHAP